MCIIERKQHQRSTFADTKIKQAFELHSSLALALPIYSSDFSWLGSLPIKHGGSTGQVQTGTVIMAAPAASQHKSVAKDTCTYQAWPLTQPM